MGYRAALLSQILMTFLRSAAEILKIARTLFTRLCLYDNLVFVGKRNSINVTTSAPFGAIATAPAMSNLAERNADNNTIECWNNSADKSFLSWVQVFVCTASLAIAKSSNTKYTGIVSLWDCAFSACSLPCSFIGAFCDFLHFLRFFRRLYAAWCLSSLYIW